MEKQIELVGTSKKKIFGTFKLRHMKNIIKSIVLVAVSAMTLASCQKNEIPAPEKQDVYFTINAGVETKTSIVETAEDGKTVYKPKWDGNEELGLLFAAPNKDTKDEDVVKLTNNESGEVASFQGNVTVDATEGTFYSFYPASAFNRGYEDGDARLDLKNVQKPTATSFDPTCDILVAMPYDYVVEEGRVEADGLQFTRVMSVLRIDLKSDFTDVQDEFVESLSFTAGDVKITGYARIFLENPEFNGNWASTEQKYCTVTANYDSDLVSINGESKSVYLVIAPVTIPANKDLTFEIKTKNYNISKTIKSPEMKFTAGNVSKINLTIAEDNCEEIDMSVDYSGEYIILGDNSGTKYAAVKYDGSSTNLKGLALKKEGDKILEFDRMADCKMVVTKVVGGTYDGLYTIKDATGNYLYAASSSANQLKSNAAIDTTNPQHYYWSIVEKDGSYEIIASKSSNRNVMQFNYNNGTPLFNCYSSASQKPVSLYPYSDIKADTTPKISVTNTSYSALATDTSVEIPYTVKNITGTIAATVADEPTMANVKTNVAADKVTVTFDANAESTEKTATIVLSYEGAESVNVTVTQSGKAAVGGPAEVTDVLTRETTGVTSTSYTAWSGKQSNSSAIYAGQSAGGNSSIQLRATNPSAIITTTSGGYAKKIVVKWNSNTSSDRTLDIYGKNTAYSATSELYTTSTQGTKLGSIKCGTSTELEINGDYQYIALRSNSGAMYLTEIQVTWEIGSGTGGVTPEPEPDQPGQGGGDAELKTSSLILSSNNKFRTSTGSTLGADDSQVWKITTISGGAIQNTYNTTYQGQQIGTSNAAWVGTFTSDFSGKNIKSIKILANTGEKANLSVTVGNVDFGTKAVTKNTSKALEYLFEGSASGNITIKVSDTSKAFYLGGIVVSYN